MVRHFLGLYIFSGAMCAGVSGTTALFFGFKSVRTRVVSLILVATSLLLFEHYFTNYYQYPYNLRAFPADTVVLLLMKNLKFVIGPLLFIMYSSLRRRSGNQMYMHSVRHLITWAAASTIIVIAAVCGRYGVVNDNSVVTCIRLLDFAALIHMCAYIVVIFVDSARMSTAAGAEEKKVLRSILVAASLTFSAIILLIVFALFNGKAAETAALVLVATVAFAAVIDPLFYKVDWGSAERAVRKVRYTRSLLSGMNTSLIGDRLEDIMESGKIYCDEDLSLERLSSLMEMSPHMLSEFINTRFGKNFNSYINSYRVDEAKSLLEEQTERSVLSIAYASGFNSKTAFYRVFTEMTGMSPGEYRTRNCSIRIVSSDL